MTNILTLKDALAVNRRKLLKIGLGAAAFGTLGAPHVITSARAQQPLAGKKIGFSQSYATDEWLKAQRAECCGAEAELDQVAAVHRQGIL